MSFKMV